MFIRNLFNKFGPFCFSFAISPFIYRLPFSGLLVMKILLLHFEHIHNPLVFLCCHLLGPQSGLFLSIALGIHPCQQPGIVYFRVVYLCPIPLTSVQQTDYLALAELFTPLLSGVLNRSFKTLRTVSWEVFSAYLSSTILSASRQSDHFVKPFGGSL
jgi:hypothetical protein